MTRESRDQTQDESVMTREPGVNTNGSTRGQSWRVEAKKPVREHLTWQTPPVWSAIGSIMLIIAVMLFDHPSPFKYGLLLAAQACYLASIVRRD